MKKKDVFEIYLKRNSSTQGWVFMPQFIKFELSEDALIEIHRLKEEDERDQ
jgi:hypothetical protein